MDKHPPPSEKWSVKCGAVVYASDLDAFDADFAFDRACCAVRSEHVLPEAVGSVGCSDMERATKHFNMVNGRFTALKSVGRSEDAEQIGSDRAGNSRMMTGAASSSPCVRSSEYLSSGESCASIMRLYAQSA